MPKALAFLGQAAVYSLMAGFIGYFSDSPPYENFPSDRAQIKLSLIHGAKRKEACRERTPEELAKLAPNMRKAMLCTRERLPVVIALELDSREIYRAVLPPTGLFSDGPSRLYAKFTIPPGRHKLELKLRDTDRAEGYDYEREVDMDLAPLQNIAIDFRAETGGFLVR